MSQSAHASLLDRARTSRARADWARALNALRLANRAGPDAALETELRRLRHEAFLSLDRAPLSAVSSAPDQRVAVDPDLGLPVAQGGVTAAAVRDAIQSHGSVIVRGLLNEEQVARLKTATVTAIAAREAVLAGAEPSAWYSEFEPIGDADARGFTSSDGLLAADSPRGLIELLDVFSDAGIDQLAGDFLGGHPVLSVEKSVLRRVSPGSYATWHQDGAFLGEDIRTLDVWIALTPCGKTAPGLEIVTRRIDRVLPTGCFFDWDLSEDVIAREYPGFKKMMPEFAPGDAILFDQLCAHRSGHAPEMTDARLAVECWLFNAATLPANYTGLVL